MRTILHLPWLLRSEPRYEKSKVICLEASRDLIKRYIFFRTVSEGSFCCKIIDFQAFSAATTLLLDLLGPIPFRDNNFQSQQKENDWKLVRDVTRVFEDLAKETPEDTNTDIVATQGLKVLRALQAGQSCESNMKLAIPVSFPGLLFLNTLREPLSRTP